MRPCKRRRHLQKCCAKKKQLAESAADADSESAMRPIQSGQRLPPTRLHRRMTTWRSRRSARKLSAMLIERYRGAAKAYMRKHCLYTLPGLRETVPLALSQDLADVSDGSAPVASVYLQRRWARISRQFMREYRKGANACEAIAQVAAKRSSRHRDPNDRRSQRVEAALADACGGM